MAAPRGAASGRDNCGGAPTAIPRPRTFLPIRAIRPEDAWCEDPASRHYNQPVRLQRGHGGDRLQRDDHLYDFIVEIDHNTSPRVAGRGSAVFLHLARDEFRTDRGMRFDDEIRDAAAAGAAGAGHQDCDRVNLS